MVKQNRKAARTQDSFSLLHTMSVWCNQLIAKPERLFLIVALAVGIPVLLLRPGYDTPDFTAHFAKAFDVASGNVVADDLKTAEVVDKQPNDINFKYVGGQLPKQLAEYANIFTPDYQFAAKKVSASDQFSLYFNQANSNDTVAFAYNTTAVYSPVAYAPQVIGIWIAKLFNVSVYATALIASLCVFLSWLALVYFAIKLSPIGKWVMLTLGLLPMTLFVAPSLSTDPLLIGVAFFYFAFLMRLLVAPAMPTRKQMIILGVIVAVIALLKQAYIPLAFLPILLYTKYPMKKIAVKTIGLTILPGILLFLGWTAVISSRGFGISTQALPQEQFVFALSHIPHVVLAVLKTSLMGLDGVVWSFFGIFGWLTLPIPLYAVSLLSAFLGLAYLVRPKEKFTLNRVQIAVLLSAVAGTVVMMLGSLYIYWTPVGASTVEGLQGRYFIPLLIFLAPLCRRLMLGESASRRAKLVLSVGVPLVLIITIFLLFRHYYPSIAANIL